MTQVYIAAVIPQENTYGVGGFEWRIDPDEARKEYEYFKEVMDPGDAAYLFAFETHLDPAKENEWWSLCERIDEELDDLVATSPMIDKHYGDDVLALHPELRQENP